MSDTEPRPSRTIVRAFEIMFGDLTATERNWLTQHIAEAMRIREQPMLEALKPFSLAALSYAPYSEDLGDSIVDASLSLNTLRNAYAVYHARSTP